MTSTWYTSYSCKLYTNRSYIIHMCKETGSIKEWKFLHSLHHTCTCMLLLINAGLKFCELIASINSLTSVRFQVLINSCLTNTVRVIQWHNLQMNHLSSHSIIPFSLSMIFQFPVTSFSYQVFICTSLYIPPVGQYLHSAVSGPTDRSGRLLPPARHCPGVYCP